MCITARAALIPIRWCQLLSPTAARAAGSGSLSGRAEIGYDSFEERYSIVDADTLDRIDEWRSRFHLSWAHGRYLENYFQLEGRALVGQDDAETAVRVRAMRQLPGRLGSRLSIDADFLHRAFSNNTDLQFPNNYNRVLAHSYGRVVISPAVALRVIDRLEVLNYHKRTEFDYDYTRNQISLATEYGPGATTDLSAGIRETSISIPDSMQIEYTAWTPFLIFRSTPSLSHSVFLNANAERRLYRPGSTRLSFWNVVASGRAEWAVKGPIGAALEDNADWYDYDGGTGIYFDSVENRTVLLARYIFDGRIRAEAGGAWGIFRSGQSPDDEYDEFGAVMRASVTPSQSAWIDVEYERGRRSYPSFSPNETFDSASVFSDYSYHRVALLAAWQFHDGLSVNAFFDYQPEDHERKGDDATATLFSANLTWAF